MKKAIKYFFAVLAAAILCLALAACGGGESSGDNAGPSGSEGTKYNFVNTSATTDATGSLESTLTSLAQMYDNTYKDSVLEVKENSIVWTIGDQEGKMTYTKDGDTYLLAGEYTEQVSQALSSSSIVGSGQSIDFSFTGEETKDGFKIHMKEEFTGNPVITYVTYTFNFTLA